MHIRYSRDDRWIKLDCHFILLYLALQQNKKNQEQLQWQQSKHRVWPTVIKSVYLNLQHVLRTPVTSFRLIMHMGPGNVLQVLSLILWMKWKNIKFLLDFFNVEVKLTSMLPNSVKMFQEETTAESDKCIDAVTHTGKEICKSFLSFRSW